MKIKLNVNKLEEDDNVLQSQFERVQMDWEENSRDVEILAKTPPTQNPIVNVSRVFVNVRSTRYIFGGDYHSKLPKVQDTCVIRQCQMAASLSTRKWGDDNQIVKAKLQFMVWGSGAPGAPGQSCEMSQIWQINLCKFFGGLG